MKNIKKIIIIFLCLFICINHVNAALDCGERKETITEISQASSTGWEAVLPICVRYVPTGDYDSISSTDSYITAKTAGAVLEKKYFGKPDGKGFTEGLVPMCSDPAATITGTAYCRWWEYEDYTPVYGTKQQCTDVEKDKNEACNSYSEGACKAGQDCIWHDPYTTATGLEVAGYCSSEKKTVQSCKDVEDKTKIVDKTCPDGYQLMSDGSKCYTVTDYNAVDNFSTTDSPESLNKYNADGYKRTVYERCKLEHSNCGCKITYTYNCPIHKCEAGDRKISTCSPAFQNSNKKSVYCVNPGQPFTSQDSSKADYQVDTTFNVNECNNSFATVDCGYANILIEGAYHQLSDNAINLALRLWGAYTGQAGFGSVGLSFRQGATCTNSVSYQPKNGEIVNVYKKTYKWAMNHFFVNSVKKDEYLNAKEEVGNFKVVCNEKDDSKIGVTCGDSAIYKQAIGLFFNTILGNKDMHAHLNSKTGLKINTEPDSVTIKTDGTGTSSIVVYTEELDEILERGQTIICVDKNGKKNPENLSADIWAQVEPYCSVTTEVIGPDGKPIKLEDEDGKALPYTLVMEKCIKGSGCRTRTFSSSICDITSNGTKQITIKAKYDKSLSGTIIKKYWSCENPTKNQLMFAYDDSILGTTDKDIGRDEKDYPVIYYNCKGACNDYTVRTNMKNNCNNDKNNYNGVYKSSMKDPSLKCIVNMQNPSYKDMYDYSDYFKVNKNFCRIFCSDEVEFYIADKVKEKAGRTFNYDIEFMVNQTKNKSFKISNVVKSKRTCVSEIYYNKNFTLDADWKKMYGLSNEQARNITNWKSLFKAIVDKATTENDRTENINQLLYDLYNCNMYQNQELYDAMGITKPKESSLKSYKGYSFDYIIEQFGPNNQYGLGAGGDCTVDNSTNTNTCVKMNNITYNYGGDPDGRSVPMKSYTSSSNTFDDVVYCSGNDCFNYDSTNKADEYNYPTSKTPSTREKIIGNRTETIRIENKDGSKTVKFNNKTTVVVPKNDYALFQISTEIDYFNSGSYETTPGDGKVYKRGTITDQNVMAINKYEYTLSKDAYNSNQCTTLDEKTKRCDLTQSFAQVKLYYRKNNNDLYTTTINNANKLIFKCYVDIEVPKVIEGPLNTLYRNVDPSDIFPYSGSCPGNSKLKLCPTDTNNIWYDNEGVIREIETTTDMLKDGQLLEYRITLTPTQIKNLKAYNNGHYIIERISNCEIKDGAYFNCKSDFLNDLRANHAGVTKNLGTLDLNYSTGVSSYSRKKGLGT